MIQIILLFTCLSAGFKHQTKVYTYNCNYQMFCFRKGSIFWCIVGTQPLLSRLAKFVIKVKFIPDKILEFCNLLKIVNFTHSYVLSYHYKDVVFLNKISIIRLMNVLQNFIFKQFLKYIQQLFWLDFYMSFVNKL